MRKKTLQIHELEKRMMLDASLGGLITPAVVVEDTVNAGPVVLDSDVSISGSTTSFDGDDLTVSTDGGGDDQISIHDEGSSAGQIGFDGTNVSYGGTSIGTVSSDGTNGSDLTVSLNASATQAGIERLIENITYANASDNPTTSRTLNISLEAYFSENMDVVIVANNEAPVVTNNGMNTSEGTTETLSSAMLGITDPDDAASDVIITITSGVSNGQLELTTASGSAITSFTLDDLDNNRVVYVHDGSDTISDSFDFTVSDGEDTTSSDTFSITVAAVDDPLSLDTNAGASISAGNTVQIGGQDVPTPFGDNELVNQSATGTFDNFSSEINNSDTQLRVVVTTPGSAPTSEYGQVIFESGGSGRGISLGLDSDYNLVFFAGNARTTPWLVSPAALEASTQYAIVIEIDLSGDELRMHYQEASDFDWFSSGRTPEGIESSFTQSTVDGGDTAGLGRHSGSIGGWNGATGGVTNFQGSIDSDFIVTDMPSAAMQVVNDSLLASDIDTPSSSILYTITTDAVDGELYNNGALLALNDTFTQDDLNNGLITYVHGGALNASDSFGFSVSDGTTTISGQTFAISVDVTNDAPVLAATSVSVNEDVANGVSIATVSATDSDVGQVLTYSVQGGTGSGIFSVNASTGQIVVLDNSTIDYESTTSYTLTVRATDNGSSPLYDEETYTINIVDVYEGTAPTFTSSGPFTIAEDAMVGDSVGTLTTTDTEGDSVAYSITGGNGDGIFAINSSSGEITILDTARLSYERDTSYTLTISATDDSPISLSTSQNVTIDITDVNDAPTVQIADVIGQVNPDLYYLSDTGNFYQFVQANINFATAQANAAAATIDGVAGYLLTITSAAENTFIDNLISDHVWLAASDQDTEGTWLWIAGPEAGSAAENGVYDNWNGSEPNSGANADAAFFNTNSRWYDANVTNRHSYVVEWTGSDLINNDTYYVTHTSNDASDITNGTSVGTVQSNDEDGDTLVYSIESGNSDGIFAIDSSTGEITIGDNTNLDASVLDTYTLTIRVTESTADSYYDEIDITVNFDEIFGIDTNTTLSVNEGATTAITTSELNISDGDTAATDITITVTSAPVNGQLELTTNPGSVINSFTLDDLNNNRVVFVHDGSETTSDSFTFSVTDGATNITGQTFNMSVVAVNDAPGLVNNTGASVAEGASVTIANTMLDVSDNDDVASALTYTASSITNGHIEVSGSTQTTFTQDDIDNSLVVFVHDGSEGDGSFAFSAADSGDDGASPVTGAFTITKTNVNDAPSISTNTGLAVLEGGQVTITTSELNATDPDDSGTGLTYTVSNLQNGYLVLSTNTSLPILDFTQDDLDNNRVIFIHGGGENDGSFDVSLADGGENSAGSDSASVSVTRTPVNDAPSITINDGSNVNQNSFVVLNRAVLLTADPDNTTAEITYTVTGTSDGQVEYLSNSGVAITSFTQSDIDNSLVIFRHSGSPPAASFDFTVSDGSLSVSDTFSLVVDNVNDAPSITTNITPTFDEGSTSTITTAMLDSFDSDDFGTELTWTISNVTSNGYVQLSSDVGVAITSFTQQDLIDGIVQFVHDGTETTSASFDVSLADGGENSAAPDTDTFSITIDPVNESPSLITNDGNPNLINFNDYTVGVFDNFQDGQNGLYTAASVSSDGSTLTISGNAWKKVDVTYTLTSNTVLSFEVFTDDTSEILGIGFDDDGNFSTGVYGYQLDGTQTWSGMDQSFNTYSIGDGWVRYDIPIGSDFTGAMNDLVFVLDKDTGTLGSAQFRNVGFYESDVVLEVAEGGSFTLTNSHINSSDVDDSGAGLTFTVSNLENGHIEVSGSTQTTFTQADVDAGNVSFVHDGSDTLSAGFDISLADGGEDSAVADTGSMIFIVTPVDDAPTIDANAGLTLDEGATATITAATLDINDSDTGLTNVSITVSSGVSNGYLQFSSNAGSAITSFTLAQLQSGLVQYVHDGSETVSDSFDFVVSDGNTTLSADTFAITITPVNDAPVITVNAGTLAEAGTFTVTSAFITATDPDDSGTGLVYSISNLSNGHVEVSGSTQTSFTQADILAGIVTFVHDGSETTSAGFDVSLADGGENSAAADAESFSLTITPVDDAPTIDMNAGISLNEGASITITTSDLEINDVDTATSSVSITVSSGVSNGYLQLSSNAGSAITSFTLAQLQSGLVQYVHDGSETVSDSFDFVVSDGNTTLSADTFAITVALVNDAPVITVNAGTLAEAGTFTITSAFITATDPDDSGTGLVYSISNLSNGHLEVSGSTQTTFTQADILAGIVTFVHDGSETTSAGFDVSLADGGENSAAADAESFSLTITPVDDAPTIDTNAGLTLDEGATATITAATLDINDSDTGLTNVSITVSSGVSNGYLQLSSNAASAITSFTLAQLQSGLVQYVHDGSETVSDSFDFVVSDGNTTLSADTFAITVVPVNDTPTLDTNAGANVLEGGDVTLTNTMLSASDADNANSGLIYTLTSLPDGVLTNTNTSSVLSASATFTQSDLDNGYITYSHHGDEGATETIRFTVGDGAALTSVQNFVLSVTAVNDAPTEILMSGGSIDENSAVGSVVATLNAVDVDVPSDSMTYSILNGGDGLFSISGNQIVSNAVLDFEALASAVMSLNVLVDDGNGGTFLQGITLTINDVSETTGSLEYLNVRPDEFYGDDNRNEALSSSSFDKFYADDDGEILYVFEEDEHSVSIMRDSIVLTLEEILEKNSVPRESFLNVLSVIDSVNVYGFGGDGPDINESDPPSEGEGLTSVVDALAFLDSMDDAAEGLFQGSDQTDDGLNAASIQANKAEQQFIDVMQYQQNKQAKLYQALLDS